MPERGPVLNRERVEAVLCRCVSLPDVLAAWGVRRPDRWPSHPIVRGFLTLTAAQLLASRGERRGMSKTAALREACTELGLNFGTTRSRITENRRKYLDQKSGGVSRPDPRFDALAS